MAVDINTVRGLMTGVFLLAFLALVSYAWRDRNKLRFEAAARLPFDDVETSDDH